MTQHYSTAAKKIWQMRICNYYPLTVNVFMWSNPHALIRTRVTTTDSKLSTKIWHYYPLTVNVYMVPMPHAFIRTRVITENLAQQRINKPQGNAWDGSQCSSRHTCTVLQHSNTLQPKQKIVDTGATLLPLKGMYTTTLVSNQPLNQKAANPTWTKSTHDTP